MNKIVEFKALNFEEHTLSIRGAPVAKALTPTVGTVKPSAKLGEVMVATGLPAYNSVKGLYTGLYQPITE